MMQKAGENINIQSASQKLKSSIKHPVSFVFFVLIAISVIFTVVSLGFLIGYILINGIPNLTPKLFAWHYTTVNAAGTDQHDMDDDTCPCNCDSIWNRRGYLYGRIREKRQ